MTLGEMQDFVVAALGLEDIDSYNEVTMVNMWLNQGVIDMLARTRCVARCVRLETQNGVDTYTLDHGILALIDMDNSAQVADDSGAVYTVPRRFRAGRTDVVTIQPSFRLIRSDVIQIVPTPSVDGMIVQCWAVLRPLAMANTDDDLGDEKFGAIPDEFQDAVITYALWKCGDYGDDTSSQQGERYRTLYEGADGRGGRLGQIRAIVNKRGTSIPVRRRVRLRGLSRPGFYVGG